MQVVREQEEIERTENPDGEQNIEIEKLKACPSFVPTVPLKLLL